MQVTDVRDYVTHAVIGGGQAIGANMANTPEMYQMLSSALYKDQILAVVRETLCNAWDAHIEAGCTDKPVRVTLTSEKLEIRDYGPGIHHDKMGEVYLTYGASTKKKDSGQTGGFGLGCKSPFAYTDHFEVTSFHQGTRTIYSLNKSSAEANGVPTCVPIVSFPTTETGLQVSLRIKAVDLAKFSALVKQIAHNGEMLVEFNGTMVETLPFSKMESFFLITNRPLEADNYRRHRINIRYGNVIYPIERNPDYLLDFDDVHSFLNRIEGYHQHLRLILQAPPNSISITPSREALSMTEHTLKTVKKLLADFLEVKKQINNKAHQVLDEQLELIKEEKLVGKLLTDEAQIPRISEKYLDKAICTVDDLARQTFFTNYPRNNTHFYKEDITKRLRAAIELKVNNYGTLQTLIKEIHIKVKKYGFYPPARDPRAYNWYKHRILRPLVRDLKADPVMEVSRLYVRDDHHNHQSPNLVEAPKYKFYDFEDYIPLLRNIVVLSHSKTNISERILNAPEMKKLGLADKYFVYHVPYAKTKLDQIRDFWKKRNVVLFDLTTEQPWIEPAPVKVKTKPTGPRVKREKLVGYPSLSGAKKENDSYRLDNCYLKGAPRVENPITFLQAIPSKAEQRHFTIYPFHFLESVQVTQLLGDECAVVKTNDQAEKLRADGLIELSEFAIQHVNREVTTNPKFLAYWQESMERAVGNKDGSLSFIGPEKDLESLFLVPEIRKELGLKTSLDAKEIIILNLWRYIATGGHGRYENYSHSMSTAKAKEFIRKLPLTDDIKDFAKIGKSSTLFPVLNVSRCGTIAMLYKQNMPDLLKIIKIIFNL